MRLRSACKLKKMAAASALLLILPAFGETLNPQDTVIRYLTAVNSGNEDAAFARLDLRGKSRRELKYMQEVFFEYISRQKDIFERNGGIVKIDTKVIGDPAVVKDGGRIEVKAVLFYRNNTLPRGKLTYTLLKNGDIWSIVDEQGNISLF